MRKSRSFLITLSLFLLCLGGCGKTTGFDRNNPALLTFWHVYGEQATSPMNRLVSEFNNTIGKDKGIIIKVTNVTSTSKLGDSLTKAQEGAPGAPDLPDLFSAHTSIASAFGTENLVDWDDYFSAKDLENYVPAFVESGRLDADGHLSVFPVSKSTFCVFINGLQFQRFSAATGVDYDDLSTWEGFFDATAKYYEWSGGKPFCALDYLISHIEIDTVAENHDIPYTESGWYDTSDPYFQKSLLKFAKPLAQGHMVVSDLYANTQVMTGETLCGIGSSAAIAYYNDTVTYPDNTSEPMQLHVLPLPKTGEGEQFYPITGVGISARKSTKEKEEAAAIFVRWLTESERNLDFAAETGYMPVTLQGYTAIDSYTFPNDGYKSLYSAIKTMQEDYTPLVTPDFPGYYQKIDTLYTGIKTMCPELSERAKNGENADKLAMELWDLFCSIES